MKTTRTKDGDDGGGGGGGPKMYSRKTVLRALAFGVFLGGFLANTVFLFRMGNKHTEEPVEEAMMLAPFVQQQQQNRPQTTAAAAAAAVGKGDGDAAVASSSSLSSSSLIQEIDCNYHHAEADPNEGLGENETVKFINQTDPNFWISLHKPNFDPLRWKSIYKGGNYYENGITEQFRKILQDAQPKGVVVDIGMNIGWFTIYSRAMGHNVLAFDPNPIMHSRVCTSLKYNQWWDGTSDHSSDSSGVTTFTYGLGDQVGGFDFALGRNPGKSSFVSSKVRWKKGIIHVPVTTLDLVATQMGWLTNDQQQKKDVIHLLKIDTEGYESYIVRGGAGLINSGLVRNLIVESTPDSEKGSTKEILEQFYLFWNAGFAIEEITNHNGLKIKGADKYATAINDELKNKKFEGSESHKYFAKTGCNMWWKQRDDAAE